MFILECEYCGKEVSRQKNIDKATCYDCRLKARRERALRYSIKERKLKKLIKKV